MFGSFHFFLNFGHFSCVIFFTMCSVCLFFLVGLQHKQKIFYYFCKFVTLLTKMKNEIWNEINKILKNLSTKDKLFVWTIFRVLLILSLISLLWLRHDSVSQNNKSSLKGTQLVDTLPKLLSALFHAIAFLCGNNHILGVKYSISHNKSCILLKCDMNKSPFLVKLKIF